MKSNNQITFNNRAEMVKEIVKAEFKGILVEHPINPLFRKILAIGAFAQWNMYGFVDGVAVKNVFLEMNDAQSIYWAFRNTGFLKALDAMVYTEHSWGWTFGDLDLLEGLISIVQSKLKDLPEGESDPNAWGALNIFKTFCANMEAINVVIAKIPCVCGYCLKGNFLSFAGNARSIKAMREQAAKALALRVSQKDIEDMYNPCHQGE